MKFYSEIEKQVHENAVKAFKDHVVEVKLEQGLYRHYRCGQPDTGIMHFHIVTFPGRLLVCGDIGDMVWERVPDMFAWAKNALHSTGYFEEKCWRTLKTKEYSADVAKESIRYEHEWRTDELSEHEQELRKKVDAERDRLISAADEGEHAFVQAYWDSEWYTGDFPSITDYTRSFLWAREALRWFFGNYKPTATSES